MRWFKITDRITFSHEIYINEPFIHIMNPDSTLSPRLNAIYELIKQSQKIPSYSYIWDCCCDHGYLGMKVLVNNLCKRLFFVDRLPHIIDRLADRLAPYDIGNHELITADAGDLSFDINHRHLVVLAGVGGECSVEIVKNIERSHPDVAIDYIFCPSTSQNALREYLASQSFSVIEEIIECEKKRCYEILYVQGKAEASDLVPVSLQCNIWDENNAEHRDYLEKINKPRLSKKRSKK